MSQAFVKEPDEGAPEEGLPERQISDHPNHVTPAGLRQLKQKVGELEQRRLDLLAAVADDDALARASSTTRAATCATSLGALRRQSSWTRGVSRGAW